MERRSQIPVLDLREWIEAAEKLGVEARQIMYISILFRSSSVVEQSAVNRSVVGSSPTCGAIFILGKYSRG